MRRNGIIRVGTGNRSHISQFLLREAVFLCLAALITLALSPSTVVAEANRNERSASEDIAMIPRSMASAPKFQICAHWYNNLILSVSNFGILGNQRDSWLDCETGTAPPSAEFPKGSNVEYLYAASLWIGAVIDADTVVSTGFDGWNYQWEMVPCDNLSFCGIEKISNRPASQYYHPDAKSDLDHIATYTDTILNSGYNGSDWEGRQHRPLGIEITQSSYSWSVGYAQDFVLIDYRIKNISPSQLRDMYVGLYVDSDIEHSSREQEGHMDDICGYLETWPARIGHGFRDTVDFAWIADNDGDPENGSFDRRSTTSVAGVRVMRVPKVGSKVSFNWWNSNSNSRFDWGPMLASTRRDFGTGGLGTPEGDRNKYYVLSNGEHDYDQVYAAVDFGSAGWPPPNANVSSAMAMGQDTRYTLSTGPFDVMPGDSLSFTVAYLAGEDFHVDPANFYETIEQMYLPDEYFTRVDFSDAAENAVWAGWIYDNPGYDTDGDGNAGRFWEYADTVGGEPVLDSFYYAGDGVPDFRAAVAPPAPALRVSTSTNKVTLRWNGLATETSKDPFTRIADFEGYCVYMGRLDRIESMGIVTYHDRFDYREFHWDSKEGAYISSKVPLTLAEIHRRYGETFDAECCPCRDSAGGLHTETGTYCFQPVGWNQSIRGWNDGARLLSEGRFAKRYADEIERGIVTAEIDSLKPDLWVRDVNPATGDSTLYLKYYEYEFIMDNLLSSVPWYFSLTAFDFGDPENGLEPLETSPIANVEEIWPINDAATVLARSLDVQVYPNPYMGDGRYTIAGYEDPGQSGSVDHYRRIHFLDLPGSCAISIYTLDGDLVRELVHPGPDSDSDSKLHWNLRSQNNELVASGIYMFVVRSAGGNQIGKLVIIL